MGCGALSGQPGSGAEQLEHPAAFYRERASAESFEQSRGGDGRGRGVRASGTLRPGGVGRDVRTRAQSPTAHGTGSRLAETGGQALRPRLLPPPAFVCVRAWIARRMDGQELLLGGNDALLGLPHQVPKRPGVPQRPHSLGSLAGRRPSLLGDPSGVAREPRPSPRASLANLGDRLRHEALAPLAPPLAHLLHGVRRDFRAGRRPGVFRRALPLLQERPGVRGVPGSAERAPP
jgi:hypothetical protein